MPFPPLAYRLAKRFTALSVLAVSACAAASGVPEPSLDQVADGAYIHSSYKDIQGIGPFLSQGLVLEAQTGTLLVDTAWNDADTRRLLAQIKSVTGAAPRAAVATHAHDDKMGGVAALKRAGVATFALELSNEDAPGRGLVAAETALPSPAKPPGDVDWPLAGESVVLFYPGPGHTRDNIVVWYAPAKILFGGCLIRPADATTLGNTADADIGNWAAAVRAVAARFPEAEVVVPSHGARGGRELFDHTIALAGAADAR
jgi:glyoxylase-like metal-dependent hydrolase (beta-lactamase superfamily II)